MFPIVKKGPTSAQVAAVSKRKARMLKALRRDDVFTIKKACEIAGVDPTCHYDWLKADKGYELAVVEAVELQVQRLEQSANERAVGINVKAPSDLLTMFLLNAKRPAIYRPQARASFEGGDGRVTFTLSLGDAGGAL